MRVDLLEQLVSEREHLPQEWKWFRWACLPLNHKEVIYCVGFENRIVA